MTARAIVTTYHRKTPSRDAHIRARLQHAMGSRFETTIFMLIKPQLTLDDNHRMAAARLARKLKLHGYWFEGLLTRGHVFIRETGDCSFAFHIPERP